MRGLCDDWTHRIVFPYSFFVVGWFNNPCRCMSLTATLYVKPTCTNTASRAVTSPNELLAMSWTAINPNKAVFSSSDKPSPKYLPPASDKVSRVVLLGWINALIHVYNITASSFKIGTEALLSWTSGTQSSFMSYFMGYAFFLPKALKWKVLLCLMKLWT